METKVCIKCNKIKDLSEFRFCNYEKKYIAKCKICFREYQNSRYVKKIKTEEINIDNVLYKKCTKCSLEKQIDQFYKPHGRKHNPHCKICHGKLSTKSRVKRKEEYSKVYKKWRIENKEKINMRKIKWYKSNSGKIKEWKLNNPQKIIIQNAKAILSRKFKIDIKIINTMPELIKLKCEQLKLKQSIKSKQKQLQNGK